MLPRLDKAVVAELVLFAEKLGLNLQVKAVEGKLEPERAKSRRPVSEL